MQNGTMEYLGNESFSMVQIILILRRQSFYYVFNLVFPTTFGIACCCHWFSCSDKCYWKKGK
uniref:Uncharacterized protein n=1 Tax=Meloidogyne enterolobii TaxID=390850 RepID=A0A6V7WH41_MELEN|nr:unnamed protein product [Meloidogyne enterolobii]